MNESIATATCRHRSGTDLKAVLVETLDTKGTDGSNRTWRAGHHHRYFVASAA
jgi:hypothetical protein